MEQHLANHIIMPLPNSTVGKNGQAVRPHPPSSAEVSVIRIKGHLDSFTSDELDRTIQSLIKASRCKIVVDLYAIEYISSMGWGVFLSHLKAARGGGGDLKLARMQPDVYQVYKVLEFEWFLKSYDTLEEALDSFERPQNGQQNGNSGTPASNAVSHK